MTAHLPNLGLRRTPRRASLGLTLLAGLLLWGCGGDGDAGLDVDFGTGGSGGTGEPSGTGGGAGTEAPPAQDGGMSGVEENPIEDLLADPERNPNEFLSPDGLGSPDYASAAAACYATPDACEASECVAFASCCVDTAQCCVPVTDEAPLPAEVDFTRCAGLTVDACLDSFGSSGATFGPREPLLTGRGLIPNGTAAEEGGASIGEPVDLSTHRTRVDVQLTLPVGCGSTCLESVGVAFTTSAPDAFVDAEVGLVLSGSRDTVSVLIGNAVVDSFAAGTDETTWSLVLSPSGTVEALRDGTVVGTYGFDSAPLSEARLVVFGRNVSAAETSAALARIETQTALCDNPRAWMNRRPTGVLIQGQAPTSVRAPSIARDGTTTWVAFELDGEIFVGERDLNEIVIDDGAALMPNGSDEETRLGDPELVWDGAELRLFYVARDALGAGSIRLATGGPGAWTSQPGPVLAPSGDVTGFDAPTVVYRDGLWIMIARATRATGVTELQAYYTSALSTGWARVVDGQLEALTRVESPTAEITSPSLVIHNSAYQLHYARRSGTRWSITLAVSDELVLWRAMGETLGASGDGFDSLGASGPDAISGPDRIDLVYTGQDGISFRLGSASRPAPSETASTPF